ncbi:hypothetical protein AJ80_05285 [Polytolypa hystricis UAMH7299]|uniref:Microbial-type PARG catalytic domain-containing protein n=1 Tax=Polytolypa hystricis (strain UAMH7299) TaxID=1447883 RepID=A0A2B7Y5X4_POLH7|nr:hypothetical protein AJ80_05285 [Polytolypa hystricis UAMH7299]
MAKTPERKFVQTTLNLFPEQRNNNLSSSHQASSLQFRRADVSPSNGQSEPEAKIPREDEMEDVQPTSSSNMKAIPPAKAAIQARRANLSAIAKETTSLLPNILATAPHAPPKGYLYAPPNPPRLHPRYCPNIPRTAIRILDADTFDTAIGLANCARYITFRDNKPVCVLNMANAENAGGGWKRGALAQEEALCYRSSLSFSLKLRYYPIPEFGAIYSPSVLVIRESMEDGHGLLDLSQPDKLPVVSVVTVAALCFPKVDMVLEGEGESRKVRELYADPNDRETMKEKMRVVLRTAAVNGHRRLVLGALGCGAFLNPREEVADCWAEVFEEREFGGGWWESVLFAVMDDKGEGENGSGNFGVFFRRLNGMMV